MNGNEHGLHLDGKSRRSTRQEACVRRAALKDAGLLPDHGWESALIVLRSDYQR